MQAQIVKFPLTENDEVALNDQDRAWIRQEINAAIRGRPLWHKILDFVPMTGFIAICIFIITQWTAYVEFRTKTIDRLDAIEKILPHLSASIDLLNPHASNTLPQAIQQNLLQKGDLGLRTVAALAAQAKQQNVTADAKQIGEAGGVLASDKVLFTGKQSSDALGALASLLAYYSSLSSPPLSSGPGLPFPSSNTSPDHPNYDLGFTFGRGIEGTIEYSGGLVPIDQAAIAEHITNPERNPNLKLAPETITFTPYAAGAAIGLEGHHLRNVVLVNMTIEYHGGPVILENVTFINCVFHLAPIDSCLSFSRSLFASNPVTFKTVG